MAQYNQIVITGIGEPNGIVNGQVGYLYLDEVNNKEYKSFGGTVWKEKKESTYEKITWEFLLNEPVGSRLQYYNITGSTDPLRDYGKVELTADKFSVIHSTGIFLII